MRWLDGLWAGSSSGSISDPCESHLLSPLWKMPPPPQQQDTEETTQYPTNLCGTHPRPFLLQHPDANCTSQHPSALLEHPPSTHHTHQTYCIGQKVGPNGNGINLVLTQKVGQNSIGINLGLTPKVGQKGM